MPPRKRPGKKSASSLTTTESASSLSTESSSSTPSLSGHTLPTEVLLNILQYVPQNQLLTVAQVSIQLARALKCLPFLSTTQIIDLLYHGDIKPLLKPYRTNDDMFAESVTRYLGSECFQKDLEYSKEPVELCQFHLLNLAGRNSFKYQSSDEFQRLHNSLSAQLQSFILPETKQRGPADVAVKSNIVVSFASSQVLEFFTKGWNTLQRFILSFRGSNPQTALTFLSRLYEDTSLTSQGDTHVQVQSALLRYPESAMKLICKLAEDNLNADEGARLVKKVGKTANLPFALLEAFFEDLIPLKNPLAQVIYWMCLPGSSLVLKKMLSHPDVDPSLHNSLSFYFCLKDGDRVDIMSLLEDGRVDPSSWEDEALMYAVKNRDVDLVTFLLKDPRVSPNSRQNEAINLAANLGLVSIFQILLGKLGADATAQKNQLFMSAVKSKQLSIVRILLHDPTVNPAARKNAALKKAAKNGDTDLVMLLLDHDNVAASSIHDTGLLKEIISSLGHREDFLKEFMCHPKVEIGLDALQFFRFTLELRAHRALKLLLVKYPNILVQAEDLMDSIDNCKSDILKILLDSGKIDPAIDDNAAVILSVQRWSSYNVELLLNDPRVDPSAQNNAALRYVLSRVYETTDFEQMPTLSYPLFHTRSLDQKVPSISCCNLTGRLLVKHPKVQQKLAEEFPSLGDPNVYARVFSKDIPF